MLTLAHLRTIIPSVGEDMEPYVAVANAAARRLMGRSLSQTRYEHTETVYRSGAVHIKSVPVSGDLVVTIDGTEVEASHEAGSALVRVSQRYAGRRAHLVYTGGYVSIPEDALFAVAQIAAYYHRLINTDSVGVEKRQIENMEVEVLTRGIPLDAKRVLEGYALW